MKTQQEQLAANAKYFDFLNDVQFLSSKDTIFGQFLGIFNQLGEAALNVNKILGTVENTIKIFGL